MSKKNTLSTSVHIRHNENEFVKMKYGSLAKFIHETVASDMCCDLEEKKENLILLLNSGLIDSDTVEYVSKRIKTVTSYSELIILSKILHDEVREQLF